MSMVYLLKNRLRATREREMKILDIVLREAAVDLQRGGVRMEVARLQRNARKLQETEELGAVDHSLQEIEAEIQEVSNAKCASTKCPGVLCARCFIRAEKMLRHPRMMTL